MDPVPECCGLSKVFGFAAKLPNPEASAVGSRVAVAGIASFWPKQRAESCKETPCGTSSTGTRRQQQSGRHQILKNLTPMQFWRADALTGSEQTDLISGVFGTFEIAAVDFFIA